MPQPVKFAGLALWLAFALSFGLCSFGLCLGFGLRLRFRLDFLALAVLGVQLRAAQHAASKHEATLLAAECLV